MSLVVVPVTAATLGLAGIVAFPAQAAATGVGGLTVTPSGTVTSSSGATVGSLAANDASTRGDVTVLGMRSDASTCAAGTAGAAQILRRSGTSWVAEQRLPHPQPRVPAGQPPLVCQGEFGRSVSTDGTRVAVAARFTAGDSPTSRGAVYVYDRDAGSWQLTATVRTPSGLDVVAVSISGDRLAVAGQPLGGDGGQRITTFVRGADGWTQDGYFDGNAPLSIDGDSIAYTADVAGRVVIADRTGDAWTPSAQVHERAVVPAGGLFDSAALPLSLAPARVLLQGGTLTIAQTVVETATVMADRVELYAKGADGWVHDGELTDPARPAKPAFFGTNGALSRDGDTVAVGAAAYNGAAAEGSTRPYGAAYVFGRGAGADWALSRPVAPTTPTESGFGDQVAVAGGALGVVAGRINSNWGDLLSYDASTGARTSAVNGDATGAAHRLGAQADVDGAVAAALTQEDVVFGATLSRNAGALYVYGRGASAWSEQAKLTSPGAAQGLTPTLRGPVVVSGVDVYAVGRTTGGRDTLLRFTRSDGRWAYADRVPPGDGALPKITDVAVSGDQMIVSTVAEGTGAPNRTSAFRRDAGRWTAAQDLGAVGSGPVHVDLTADGTVLALAARGDMVVRIYRPTAQGWQSSDKLTLPEAPAQPLPEFAADGRLGVVNVFGKPWVAFFGPDPATPDRLAAEGAWTSPDDVDTFGAGAAGVGEGFLVSRTDSRGISHLEVLERSGTSWGRTGEFPGGTRAPFDDFGTLVAADAKTLLVGAPGTNSAAGREAGAVHLYTLTGSDTTKPTVTGSPDRPAGATIDGVGWWKGDVTVTWTATDEGSGLAGPVPAPTTVTEEGRTTATSTQVCDKAGNCATGSYELGIDRTPPVVTIGGVADGKTYVLGSVPTATCSATDQLTGLDGTCAVSVTGGNANDVGSFTVSATARDRVGNSTTVKASYDVHYPWSGFLQPINDTAHEVSASTSVFKAGSTVPVKFSLRDAAGRLLAPTSTPVWVTPVKGSSTNLPVGEPEFTDAPDAGIVYQLRDGQWKYNWKTDRSQAGSYWRIGVRLDDGSVHQVTIALQ